MPTKPIDSFLFTFIADFRGGIYVSQVWANSVNEALMLWPDELTRNIDDIAYLGKKVIQEIRNRIKDGLEGDDQPTSLKQIQNTWFQYIPTSMGPFLMNIVKTSTH